MGIFHHHLHLNQNSRIASDMTDLMSVPSGQQKAHSHLMNLECYTHLKLCAMTHANNQLTLLPLCLRLRGMPLKVTEAAILGRHHHVGELHHVVDSSLSNRVYQRDPFSQNDYRPDHTQYHLPL